MGTEGRQRRDMAATRRQRRRPGGAGARVIALRDIIVDGRLFESREGDGKRVASRGFRRARGNHSSPSLSGMLVLSSTAAARWRRTASAALMATSGSYLSEVHLNVSDRFVVHLARTFTLVATTGGYLFGHAPLCSLNTRSRVLILPAAFRAFLYTFARTPAGLRPGPHLRLHTLHSGTTQWKKEVDGLWCIAWAARRRTLALVAA